MSLSAIQPLGVARTDVSVRSADWYLQHVREIEPHLSRIALRLCAPDRDRAADCLQTAVVNGYRAYMAGQFQGSDGFFAWMVRILTNEFYADCRRRRREVTSSDLVEERGEVLAAESSSDPNRDMLSEDIVLAIRSLPPEARACVVMVDLEGATYEEAATLLGVKVGTIRSRLFRARLQLASQLAQYRDRT